ncbi:hypothetical protein [Agrobacterium tumefaciens]|uniref:hypothetical protein n=1 Tax=Agrobacterium tumefaciens TaxID=358 RepID=UPI0015716DC5|nr:hypothetical protein [Agrobacterium tumefaciens]
MAETLTIIFDYPRNDTFAFDIVFQGKRYRQHRDTKEGCRFAFDVRKTAERFGGFRWITARNAFITAYTTTGDEPEQLIAAFERQGYSVELRGAVAECLPMQNAA